MDSSALPKEEIWFLRVCHHISNAVYFILEAGGSSFFGYSKTPHLLDPLERAVI
jgi:hypothetical protein